MPIYDDLDDRYNPTDRIERCRRDFEATGNPLYAWEAWTAWSVFTRSRWRSFKEPLPRWLTEYFDGCARHLVGVTRQKEYAARPGVGPGSIGLALQFKKGLAATRQGWGGPYDHRERLALDVVDLMWSDNLSLDAAAAEAQHRKWASHRAARRAVEGAEKYALRWMLDRLHDATRAVPERSQVVGAYSNLCKSRSR